MLDRVGMKKFYNLWARSEGRIFSSRVYHSFKCYTEDETFRKTVFSGCKCSKISNNFLFLFTNKMLVIRAASHQMLV